MTTPVRTFGIPRRFLPHGTRAEVLAEIGLTAQDVSRAVTEVMAQALMLPVLTRTATGSARTAAPGRVPRRP